MHSRKQAIPGVWISGHWAAPAAARVGLAIAAAGCLFALVRIGLLTLAGPALPVPALPAGDAVSATTAAPALPLSAWHLFGLAGTTSTAVPTSGENGLRLRGTVAAARAGDGMAIIASAADGRERAYALGAQLPGGARLVEVFPDHVTIERDGRRERLELSPRPATSTDDSPTPPAAARPAPVQDASGGYLRAVPAFGAPDLASARAEQAPALQVLAASANLLPVTENGRLLGVRIALPDPSGLREFGLDPQDVITAVNGIPLDQPERQQALLASLVAGGSVTLQVVRDGRERTVSIGY